MMLSSNEEKTPSPARGQRMPRDFARHRVIEPFGERLIEV